MGSCGRPSGRSRRKGDQCSASHTVRSGSPATNCDGFPVMMSKSVERFLSNRLWARLTLLSLSLASYTGIGVSSVVCVRRHVFCEFAALLRAVSLQCTEGHDVESLAALVLGAVTVPSSQEGISLLRAVRRMEMIMECLSALCHVLCSFVQGLNLGDTRSALGRGRCSGPVFSGSEDTADDTPRLRRHGESGPPR